MEKSEKHPTGLRLYLPLILALVLVIGFLLGVKLSSNNRASVTRFLSPSHGQNELLNHLINYISISYVDSIDQQQLVEETIHALLRNLDPHSTFIPARDFQAMNDPLMGSFEGIGIEFNMILDTVVVINPIAGGPSQKAGLMPGDRIVKVGDENIAGVELPTNDVVRRLRGEKGTEITVKVLRRGVADLLPFTIVRDVIPQYSLDIAYMVDENIGYIRLNKFSATTHQEFVTAMRQLQEEGMKQLILDLRGNGGGVMDASIALADEFLSAQKLIVYTEGFNRQRQEVYSRRGGGFETQPLVILIDEWSASASEIVAGAVQDHDRGIIIGRRSFGKGLVQEQVNLADGSALRLTVARYHTPSGRSIQRPYQQGEEQYYFDLMQRMMGDAENPPQPEELGDTIQFRTSAGRIVFGGGGITPDIVVPMQSGEQFVFFNQAANKGLINRFAFNYSDRNRAALMRFANADAFVTNFTISQGILNDFLGFARAEGLSIPSQVHPESLALIRQNLKALIGRNIFGAEAFFPVLLQRDQTFTKAVDVLRQGTYRELTAGVARP
ncbi:MAG TPA: peptidase S41 [Bacteroidales bacterium]|nr:peptidase S41 [Bacteroidales bacterium]